MFDIGAGELLLIAIVAIIFIGPKDLPLALRTAGRWIGKVRKVSNHFRTGLDTMIREAEMEEMEKKWKEQNARIMAENPGGETKEGALPEKTPEQVLQETPDAVMEPTTPPASAEARTADRLPPADEPRLPPGTEKPKE